MTVQFNVDSDSVKSSWMTIFLYTHTHTHTHTHTYH